MIDDELGEFGPQRAGAEPYVTGVSFYVALVKNGYAEEAREFAEWFLETFDLDLET